MTTLTTAQLATLQSDLDAIKTAVAADATAQTTLAAAQAAFTQAQQVAAGTQPAVDQAEQQLLSDVDSMLNPPATSTTAS